MMDNDLTNIIFLGIVNAGFPSPADEWREQPLNLHDLVVKHALSTYFMRVQGDSMTGACLYPNDVIVVGVVQAERNDPLSQYYDTQGILRPLPIWDQGVERPAYLITANALVWREALAQIGGFDERFPSAAGEDIDLGLRLWSVGPLSYAPVARVLHTFEPDLCAFVRRFVRYGRGNRRLAARYKVDLAPSPFVPHDPSPTNWLLAHMQFLTLWWGYHTAWPARGWSMSPSTPAWSTAPPAVVLVHVERLPQQNSPEVHL